jgi:hypothetical protein
MLKIKELKNGFFVKANGTHEGKVMSISHFDNDKSLHQPIVFFNESNGVGEYLKDCEPIPLTNDVLKACGSSQGHDTDMWRNPVGVWLTKVHNKEKFFVQGFRAGYTISFLHEYQNVVSALTGEELNVNW